MAVNPLVIGTGADDYPESEPLGRRIDVSDTHVTGVLSGLVLAREGPTTFGYSAGEGALTDFANSSNSKKIPYPAGTGIAITITDPFERIIVSLTDTGSVNQRKRDDFSPEIFHTEVVLGQLELTQTGQIRTNGVVQTKIVARSFAMSFADWLYSSGLWFLLEQGFIISPNGPNVRLDLSAGVVFWPGVNLDVNVNDPNRKAYPELKPMPFNPVLQNGTVTGIGILDVDTANYDLGGTLTPISPANRWGYHLFFTDDGGEIWMSYGQNIDFNTVEEIVSFFDALLEEHVFPPQYRSFSKIIGAVLFRANNTDFTDTTETVIYDRFFFGVNGGGGSGGVGGGTVKSVANVFPDANANVQADTLQSQADATKFLNFNLAAVAASTTRTLAAQDVDGTLPVQVPATFTQGSVPFAAIDGRLAEANPGLVFDGTSILTLENSANARLDMRSDGDNTGNIDVDMNRSAPDVNLGGLRFLWDNTQVVQFMGRTGPTTATKNDGSAVIRTASAGSAPADRLVVDNTGKVIYPGVGSAPIQIEADANATAAGDPLLVWTGKWNGTPVVEMRFEGGVDDTAKNEGRVRFRVSNNGVFVNSITMKHNGFVAIGRNVTDPQGELHVEGTTTVSTIVFATPTQRYDMRVNTVTGDWNLTDFTAGSLTPFRVKLGAATNTLVIEDARIGVNTNIPDVTTALDVVSTKGGIAPPELTTAQRDAILNPKRQIISNVTTNKLQYYTGSAWVDLH